MKGTAVILAAVLMASCTKKEVRHVTVLQDVTGEAISVPEPKTLIAELGLDAKSWKGVEFKYGIIGDTEYTREEVLSLPAESSLMGNEFERKQKGEDFMLGLETLMGSLERGNRPHSIIFPVIIREVNRLGKIVEPGEKTLIVFSDLMENAPTLSCRNRNVGNMDREKAAKLWQGLVSNYGTDLGQDLTGVEVRFIHGARGYEESRQFSNLCDMYRRALEGRGATVNVSANL